VFDDGQRIFSDQLTGDGEIAPLDELAGIIRGAGIGIWPIIQTTVGFSRRLRPNLASRFLGAAVVMRTMTPWPLIVVSIQNSSNTFVII
jgi:hypothetical protein